MRFSSTILFTSALAGAAQAQDAQKPLLASWLDKAKTYVSSGIPSPLEAGAAVIAKGAITELTTSNWQQELHARPATGSPQNWMIQVTGGNKTCAGLCGDLDANFNKTAALLSATPAGPRLGRVNCDKTPALCSILFTSPPVLWYIQTPGIELADQPRAETPIYVKGLNATATTSVQEMVDFHSKKTYLELQPIKSYMHPYDGILSQYGLNVPFGYVLYVISVIPSWSVMLLVSFATRNIMSRRASSRSANELQAARTQGAAAGGGPGAKKGIFPSPLRIKEP